MTNMSHVARRSITRLEDGKKNAVRDAKNDYTFGLGKIPVFFLQRNQISDPPQQDC